MSWLSVDVNWKVIDTGESWVEDHAVNPTLCEIVGRLENERDADALVIIQLVGFFINFGAPGRIGFGKAAVENILELGNQFCG